MKIKITRTDGTVIEAEGTAEECARLLPVPTIRYVPPATWIYREPPWVYPQGTWCDAPAFTFTKASETIADGFLTTDEHGQIVTLPIVSNTAGRVS